LHKSLPINPPAGLYATRSLQAATKINLSVQVIELVVAELVEASKRPQEKANEVDGFDRLSHRKMPIGFKYAPRSLRLKTYFQANWMSDIK